MTPHETQILFAGIATGMILGALAAYPIIAAVRYGLDRIYNVFAERGKK